MIKNLMGKSRLDEMVIINPKLCKQLSIQVEVKQGNEGLIPHLHIYLEGVRNTRKCSCVRLDRPEYFLDHKHNKKLNGAQKEELLRVLNAPWPGRFIQSIYNEDDIRQATGYMAAVQTWIDSFGETAKFKYDEDGFPIIPDYERLMLHKKYPKIIN